MKDGTSETSFTTPNRRILIIDDNPAIHADFQKILCPAGQDKSSIRNLKAALFDEAPQAVRADKFELVSAHQGQEGLELVKKSLAENRPFALAFVDVRMPPGWDGIETVARIWETYPQLQVVICTAYSDYSWEEMRTKLDQTDSLVILKKPFDNVEVQQLAHAMTKKWLLNQQSNHRLTMAERRKQELLTANESLRRSEERFAKAFQGSCIPSAIQSLPEQRLVDVNERLVALTGRSRGELIGRTPAELGLWEKPDEVAGWFAHLQQSGKDVCDQTTKLRVSSGALREVLVSLSCVMMDNQPHALLLAQDISERLLLERQLRQAQKMEGVGQLAAGVAHDFNNILTVIQGHAGLLNQQHDPNSKQKKSIDQIAKAATRAATLIRQLLTFSRKQVMQCRHLDINDTLGNTIAMLQRLVGEHVQLEFSPGQLLPAIRADMTMVEQIVMNLATNARDAMPNGGRINISTSLCRIQREPTPLDPVARKGGFVLLSFSDTGCGMDTSVLTRIFEPFFTTKEVGKGSGLGLATVFGIIRQHDGWIEVESRPGHGTTFRIYFPPSEQLAEKIEAVAENQAHPGRETILVAEDEDALREMVAQVLMVQGYKVLTAASGRQALRVYEQSGDSIDLLLTDMVMPEGIMGGQLAEQLKANNPRLRVIYTSGYSPGMAGKDMSLLEGRNFLPKPYSVGKLAQFVRECLDAPLTHN